MAYGAIHFFPGGTQRKQDGWRSSSRSGGLPEGQTFHAAGASEGGWTIVAVHDSKDGWERFRNGTLTPRMQQGIEGGFETPPEETGFEIHNLLP